MPTERPEPVPPFPATWYSVLPASDRQETAPTEIAGRNNTHRLPPENVAVSPWAAVAVPHQIIYWHIPSSPSLECSRVVCGRRQMSSDGEGI